MRLLAQERGGSLREASNADAPLRDAAMSSACEGRVPFDLTDRKFFDHAHLGYGVRPRSMRLLVRIPPVVGFPEFFGGIAIDAPCKRARSQGFRGSATERRGPSRLHILCCTGSPISAGTLNPT
jgi:hypothetical protein